MSENQLATTQSPPKPNALAALASRLDMDPKRTAEVLKATAFKSCKNDDQFAALVVVSNTYGLNPLLKELYAFPGKGGEIVPIVSIDGWLRIINDHPEMDGMSDAWADDGSWCEITIYRKDRKHPTIHREYLEEVKRGTEPWKQHPRRMLKWKTIIQAGRITFGFGGIHDEEEGQTIGMRDVTETTSVVPRDEPVQLDANPQAEVEIVEEEAPIEEIDLSLYAQMYITGVEKSKGVNPNTQAPFTRYRVSLSNGTEVYVATSFSTSVGDLAMAEQDRFVMARTEDHERGLKIIDLRQCDQPGEEELEQEGPNF